MFKPVNRYILVEHLNVDAAKEESLIVLPEDYKPQQERFVTVAVVDFSEDIRFDVLSATKLVVDRTMIEEISIGGTIYNVILDNYVVGIIE
tara:strand:+ start:103 stop:375 length:273 start_codon:yes stop_codon:yes gene_type:complete